jgi:hypothetical protein
MSYLAMLLPIQCIRLCLHHQQYSPFHNYLPLPMPPTVWPYSQSANITYLNSCQLYVHCFSPFEPVFPKSNLTNREPSMCTCTPGYCSILNNLLPYPALLPPTTYPLCIVAAYNISTWCHCCLQYVYLPLSTPPMVQLYLISASAGTTQPYQQFATVHVVHNSF